MVPFHHSDPGFGLFDFGYFLSLVDCYLHQWNLTLDYTLGTSACADVLLSSKLAFLPGLVLFDSEDCNSCCCNWQDYLG